MIDNTSLQIEDLKILRGSYREAFFEFMEKHEIYDPIDLWEVIHPIIQNRIKQEYIDNNNFSKDSPFAKQNDLSEFFE